MYIAGKHFRLFCAVFGVFLFTSHAAASANPRICPSQISACGCTITMPGEYHIIASLTESSETEDCITVDKISVLFLDGNGIISTAPPSDSKNSNAVHLTRNANRAVVVGSGANIAGFTNALLVEDLGANIGGFRASQNDEGLFINFATNVTVYNFDVSDNSGGIEILHSRNVSLSNFSANNTTSDAIFISGLSGGELVSFQANSNASSGVYIEEGGCNYVLTGCHDLNSQHIRIFGGTILNNGFTGISLAHFFGLPRGTDFNQIIGNTVQGNVDGDLDEQNPNCEHNLWIGNLFGTASQTCVH
jgi:hypothetical protein